MATDTGTRVAPHRLAQPGRLRAAEEQRQRLGTLKVFRPKEWTPLRIFRAVQVLRADIRSADPRWLLRIATTCLTDLVAGADDELDREAMAAAAVLLALDYWPDPVATVDALLEADDAMRRAFRAATREMILDQAKQRREAYRRGYLRGCRDVTGGRVK